MQLFTFALCYGTAEINFEVLTPESHWSELCAQVTCANVWCLPLHSHWQKTWIFAAIVSSK